jgi:hypothetical protein
MNQGVLEAGDLDVEFGAPEGLQRILQQGLVDLSPWHILTRDIALKRLHGMRRRYARRYVPFASRQDNDDVACFDPALPGRVVIVHDFASETSEARRVYATFWDWFRAAIDDMITFE